MCWNQVGPDFSKRCIAIVCSAECIAPQQPSSAAADARHERALCTCLLPIACSLCKCHCAPAHALHSRTLLPACRSAAAVIVICRSCAVLQQLPCHGVARFANILGQRQLAGTCCPGSVPLTASLSCRRETHAAACSGCSAGVSCNGSHCNSGCELWSTSGSSSYTAAAAAMHSTPCVVRLTGPIRLVRNVDPTFGCGHGCIRPNTSRHSGALRTNGQAVDSDDKSRRSSAAQVANTRKPTFACKPCQRSFDG